MATGQPSVDIRKVLPNATDPSFYHSISSWTTSQGPDNWHDGSAQTGMDASMKLSTANGILSIPELKTPQSDAVLGITDSTTSASGIAQLWLSFNPNREWARDEGETVSLRVSFTEKGAATVAEGLAALASEPRPADSSTKSVASLVESLLENADTESSDSVEEAPPSELYSLEVGLDIPGVTSNPDSFITDGEMTLNIEHPESKDSVAAISLDHDVSGNGEWGNAQSTVDAEAVLPQEVAAGVALRLAAETAAASLDDWTTWELLGIEEKEDESGVVSALSEKITSN
ncbi:hypothetical protein RYH80_18520 [Halobaculum sp. MBLA0147]|uniref:hypothetical protein n=1 Tax=Halobaculum sp. MBLA0147 TaxID=3079934 RepID=UPI0035262E9B